MGSPTSGQNTSDFRIGIAIGRSRKAPIALVLAQAILWKAYKKDPTPVSSEQAMQWPTPGNTPTTVTSE